MLYNRESYVSIREERPYWFKRYGKKVIVPPLRMCQEINDAMGKHPDKKRESWFIDNIRKCE